MSKKKPRRLWLSVQVKDFPRGVGHEELYQVLMDSITEGSYQLPRAWQGHVFIQWRNKEDAPMRSGEWTQELEVCAQSSNGFELAVLDYLERVLEKWREQEEERRAATLRRIEDEYRRRDEDIRARNQRGELSDIRATIERTRLRQWRAGQRKRVRGHGGDA